MRPGHVFPLQAKENGVLERAGHTEGAVDLMRLAGLKPAAVLSEVMNQDGTMAKSEALTQFVATHHLPLLSIEDIIHYRLQHESMIDEQTSASLTLSAYGDFTITVIKEKINHMEHVVLTKKHSESTLPLLVRIHSSCMTGDLFASCCCDCHQQLHYALTQISVEGGMLIYLNQEGRGIGLFNKIKAYALQEAGLDTVEANVQLALPVDARKYYLAAHILKDRNITHVRLLTNNPEKVADLKQYGIQEVTPVCIPVLKNQHNARYLETKRTKLQHTIQLKETSHAAEEEKNFA